MQLNGARILIECLIREGVNIIFGYPGGSVLDIYDELPQYGEQLRHVLVRHEQAAVHAADGYARATGKVGVCMATSGPGATNTVTGIATAYCDSIPMVIFTGQVPTGLIGNDAFQEVDIAGITRPCTKHNYVVKDVKELAKVVRQAFYLARSGRPGPVLVDLPKNVLQGSAEFVWPEDVSLRSYNPTYRPNYAQIRKVVDALMKQLEEPMRTAVSGALNRAVRNRRPRHAEIDWNRTIRANLKHWQQEYKTIVPETLIGYGRKSQRVQREIILCIDQSGSMASSVVYSSIFGAVMASMPAVKTHLVVFDTAVVDMTEQLDDPVDLLFGVQLGGGTDINRAVGYCQSLIRDPRNTILVLISDLYEGGVEKNLLQRANELVQSGVQVITLLALSNEGAPFYDKGLAAKLAGLDIPSFACTPDLFPGMMAAAIRKEDVNLWAAKQGIVVPKG